MRDYQRVKRNKYLLPKPVYHQTLWIIRDYNRIKSIANDMIKERPSDTNSFIRGSGNSDPTSAIVFARERHVNYLRKVECALNTIPNEYRTGVWNNIVHYRPYPDDADRATYGRYKSKFIHAVAERFELI